MARPCARSKGGDRGTKVLTRAPELITVAAPLRFPLLSQRIKLAPEQAIFLFVSGGTLPPSVATLQSVYDQHHDEDGFLYMTYSGENFFG